jgi:hypothetical protein
MKKSLIAALLLLAAAPAYADSPLLLNGGLRMGGGPKTATAVAGAATLNQWAGVITTESATTAAAANYTLTLTDSRVAANSQVFASVALGTATTGVPVLSQVRPAAGSVVIIVRNVDATNAFNGTLRIAFVVLTN